jgi:DNA-binding NtrC family response regulator
MKTMETPGRILLVEPNEIDLLNMTALLQREGFHCTPVQDGFETAKALEANAYDLMIIEIQLPCLDGLELIQALERRAPGVPAIIHTAHPSLRSAIAAVQLPVAAYLIKPVQPGALLRQVKTSICNYQACKRKESLLERTIVFSWAIEETIQVLESTRSSFKSQKLAALRRHLERILADE